MDEISSVSPTEDERLLAAIAHASILLAIVTSALGGVIVALIIWLAQRHKSRFVAQHAWHAFVYQVVGFVLTLLVWGCWFLAFFGSILVPLTANPRAYGTTPPVSMFVGIALIVVPLLFGTLWTLYGLWAAVRAFQGHPFRYFGLRLAEPT
ncbi:MAG: DUF4870 domain-containing protein [Ardenticatenaceae bacterium]|nr:DUF4870 domain-containing protein [Ardenticatenaceae bacterium]